MICGTNREHINEGGDSMQGAETEGSWPLFLVVKVGASGGFGEAERDGDDVVGVGVLDIDGG